MTLRRFIQLTVYVLFSISTINSYANIDLKTAQEKNDKKVVDQLSGHVKRSLIYLYHSDKKFSPKSSLLDRLANARGYEVEIFEFVKNYAKAIEKIEDVERQVNIFHSAISRSIFDLEDSKNKKVFSVLKNSNDFKGAFEADLIDEMNKRMRRSKSIFWKFAAPIAAGAASLFILPASTTGAGILIFSVAVSGTVTGGQAVYSSFNPYAKLSGSQIDAVLPEGYSLLEDKVNL